MVEIDVVQGRSGALFGVLLQSSGAGVSSLRVSSVEVAPLVSLATDEPAASQSFRS